MISRLRGELIEVSTGIAVIDVAGVGYDVLVPDVVAARLPDPGNQVTLLIRQIFREDGVTLCGFTEHFQRRLFDLLLGVKGCGPKVAMALIGQVGEEAVANAIQTQDARTLCKATGVGARLAERVILELKDKVGQERALTFTASLPRTQGFKPADELVDALMDLGYRRPEAERAAELARAASGELEAQLKHALGALRK